MVRYVPLILSLSWGLIGFAVTGYLTGIISGKNSFITIVGGLLLYKLGHDVIRIKREEAWKIEIASFIKAYDEFCRTKMVGLHEGSDEWWQKLEEFRAICKEKGQAWEVMLDIEIAKVTRNQEEELI